MSGFAPTPPLPALIDTLDDPTSPVPKLMRAAYYVRNVYERDSTTKAAKDSIVRALCRALEGTGGALIRHEYAYVLGQIGDGQARECLERVLREEGDNVMVRHECGEALGAIGDKRSIPILMECTKDERIEVGQTCEVAANFIRWRVEDNKNVEDYESDPNAPVACACMLSPYDSKDPAPPSPEHANLSTRELGEILRNEKLELFERYKSMFSLRNRGGDECVSELGNTLVEDDSSALLRHEVAYVLGQMAMGSGFEFLVKSLRRPGEHSMVRHEAAEALGAIGDRWDDCEKVLEEFRDDEKEDIVVRESCQVALDAADYFGLASSIGEGDTLFKDVKEGAHFNVAVA